MCREIDVEFDFSNIMKDGDEGEADPEGVDEEEDD